MRCTLSFPELRDLGVDDRSQRRAVVRTSAHAPVADRDAAGLAVGQRAAPAGLLLQHLEDLDPAFVLPLLIDADAIVERVLSGSARQVRR